MKRPLPHASGARVALVVDQEHLTAFSSNEAHDVVLVFQNEHYAVKTPSDAGDP